MDALHPKKGKDYAFRRQFDEKQSIIPGCPALHPKHIHATLPVLMQLGKHVALLSSRVENYWQMLLTAQPQPQGDQALLHVMYDTGKLLHDLWQSAACAKLLLLWILQ